MSGGAGYFTGHRIVLKTAENDGAVNRAMFEKQTLDKTKAQEEYEQYFKKYRKFTISVIKNAKQK